jgi:uncharacterized RDD family membrane protein YckC
MSSHLPGPGTPVTSFADKLTIETPEQTALDFPIAGVGSRFLALAIDTLIQMLVGLIVGLGGSMAIAGISVVMPSAGVWGLAVMLLFYFLLYFGYFAFFEILWNGQTPGKRKAGIRVIKDSGRPLTPAESIGRNLLRIVDWLPAFYAAGIASAVLTKGNKRLGDLVVGSLVVRESSLSELKPLWQTSQDSVSPPLSPLGAANLSLDEFALIDSFLNRRNDLDADVRYRMADQIFRRLAPKLSLPADRTLSTETILESLARERRATGHYA